MKSDSLIHNRKNIRLKGFDYSTSGSYFITICTGDHKPFFGIVRDDKMLFNDVSRIAAGCWENLPEHFPMVSLDEYVFMPNHFHGIINISNNKDAMNRAPTRALMPNPDMMNHAPTRVLMPNPDAMNRAPTRALMPNPDAMNRAPTRNRNEFVGAQFIAPKNNDVSDQGLINQAPTLGKVVRSFKALSSRKIRLSGKDAFRWQRNYYEHIIRNEDSLNYIREYIITNPLRWELDRENPDSKGEDEFDKWLVGAQFIASDKSEDNE